MLTEICGYLNNYFIDKAYIGAVSVQDGAVSCDGSEISMNEGQYFTLVREKYVLGVYQYGAEIPDKSFDGAVWVMDIPDAVLGLAKDIADWMAKYGSVDSEAMSPFNSESFGGYSYSKTSGNVSNDQNNGISWQNTFGSRLAIYRRLK